MIELSNNEAASLVKLAARGVSYPWGLGEEAAHVSRWLLGRRLPVLELFSGLYAWVDERDFASIVLTENTTHWQCGRDELCPLVCGSALIDSADSLLSIDAIELPELMCPLLLVPFISEASVELNKPICMTLAGERLIVNASKIELVGHDHETIKNHLLKSSPQTVSISLLEPVIGESTSVANTVASADTVLKDVVLTNNASKDLASDAPSIEGQYNALWPPLEQSRVRTELLCLETLKQYAHRTYAPATELSRQSGAGAGTSDND